MINKYKTIKTLQTMREQEDRLRVALIGSRTYENKTKIREMIFKLKQTFGTKLEIVSGGNDAGADRYIKKYALEMGVSYKEFNPAYTVKNLYSAMPEAYYGKPYHASQLYHRQDLIAKYCDKMIVFIDSQDTSKQTYYAVNMAKKHSKPVVVISDKA